MMRCILLSFVLTCSLLSPLRSFVAASKETAAQLIGCLLCGTHIMRMHVCGCVCTDVYMDVCVYILCV